jgi:MFS family permease
MGSNALTSPARYCVGVKRLSRDALLLIWITFFASGGGAAVTVLFNLYLLTAGAGTALLGTIAGASAAAAAIGALPSGWLSDRIGRRDFLLLAGAVGGAAQLAQILWPRPSVLIPAAWVGGLATVALAVVVAPLMAERSDAEGRQSLFSLVAAAGLVAGVAGNLLGGWLPARLAAEGPFAADRTALLVATGFQLLALPAVLGLPNDRRSGPGLRLRLPPALPRLLVPEILIGLGAGLFIPFYNVFLARHLGAATATIGVVFSVQALVAAGFTLLAPRISRKIGRVPAMVGLQLGSLPFLATMALSGSLPVVAGAGFVRSGLMNSAGPLENSLEMEAVDPGERALANAAIGMAWNGAWAVSAWVAGFIMRSSLTVPYWITMGCYAAAATSVHLLLRPLDRRA